jgi:hypothetical protein
VPKQESTEDRTIGQDLQTRQHVSEDAVRAGCSRRAGTPAECRDAWSVALDRPGIEAASLKHAGDGGRQGVL